MNEWTDGRTNEGTKGRKNERRNELTKGLTGLDGWKGRRTNELTYGQMNEWMNIIVLLFIQNNYCLKQGKNELLANRTSKNADLLRWLMEAVFTRIFWLFVLFSSVTLVIWTLLFNFFSLRPKKKTVKALCDGEFHSQPSTITHYMTISQPGIKEWKIQAHFTDLITRVILSNITVWEITLIHVSPVNFRTKGWGNRLSQRRATPEATDHPRASNKETWNITALFFSTQRFSPSSFSCQTFPLSK